MTGVQHRAMGVSYAYGKVVAKIILGNLSVNDMIEATIIPFATKIPDIDHDRSKLGRVRKKVVLASKIGLGIAALYLIITSFMESINRGVYVSIGLSLTSLALFLLYKDKSINKTLKFSFKHRGLTHTLIFPIAYYFVFLSVKDLYAKTLMMSLLKGHVIHLIGDLMTVSGCPLLFPFSRKSIRLLPTDSSKSKSLLAFICGIWCIVLFFGQILLARGFKI